MKMNIIHARIFILIELLDCIAYSSSDLSIGITGSPGSGDRSFPVGTQFTITCSCRPYPCSISLRRDSAWEPGVNFVEIMRETNINTPLLYSSILTRDTHQAHFHCIGLNNVGDAISESKSNDIFYSVKWLPENLWLTETNDSTTYAEGNKKTVVCRASEAHPIADIRWYLGDQEQYSSPSFNILSTVIQALNNAGERTSTVTFDVTRRFHGLKLNCAVFQGSSNVTNNTDTFNVNFPPKELNLTQFRNSYTVGQTVSVSCKSDSSNPASILTLSLGAPIASTFSGILVNGDYNAQGSNAQYNVTARKDMNGMSIKCELEYQTSRLFVKSWQLMVYFPHDVILDILPVLNEGASVGLACRASGGNPALVEHYTWTVCKKYVYKPGASRECTDFQHTTNVLDLDDIDYTASGNYSCAAKNNAGYGISETRSLQVNFLPVYVSSDYPIESKIGDSVQIKLLVWAFPNINITFTWIYPDGEEHISESETGPYNTVITTIHVKIKSFGNYTCIVRNEVGPASFSFTLRKHTAKDSESAPIAIIAGSTAGGLLLIAIPVICIFIWRRKKKDSPDGEYSNVDNTGCCRRSRESLSTPDTLLTRPPGIHTLNRLEQVKSENESESGPPQTMRYTREPTSFLTSLHRFLKKNKSSNETTGAIELPSTRDVPDAQDVRGVHDTHLNKTEFRTAESVYINMESKTKPYKKKQISKSLFKKSGSTYENWNLKLNESIRLSKDVAIKKKTNVTVEAFAEVWKIHLSGSKVLPSEEYLMKTSKDKDLRVSKHQLLLELKALSQTEEHSNIVKLLAFRESAVEVCLVLPYYTYGHLEAFLFDHRTTDYFEQEHLLSFALDVADAMTFLHSRNPPFLHPNLNLNQVYVEDAGNGLMCKVCGFLFESDMQLYESIKWKRDSNDVYRPPEIHHKEIHTKLSDVWDFGMMLYQLITLGERPFLGETDKDARQFIKIKNNIPKPEPCSGQMRILVSDCLSPHVSARPEFATVCAELAKLCDDGKTHIDVVKARNNLNYVNPTVIAQIAQSHNASSLKA